MSFMKIIRNRRGSYIAEAALTLPVFILCVTALALIIRIIAVCENIGFVTALEARDISISSVSLCCKIRIMLVSSHRVDLNIQSTEWCNKCEKDSEIA